MKIDGKLEITGQFLSRSFFQVVSWKNCLKVFYGLRMMYYSVSDTSIFGKKNPSAQGH